MLLYTVHTNICLHVFSITCTKYLNSSFTNFQLIFSETLLPQLTSGNYVRGKCQYAIVKSTS